MTSIRVLLVVLVLALVSSIQASFVETVYTTTLTPQQVHPSNGILDISYVGAAICQLLRQNEAPFQLDCEIQHNVTNVTTIDVRQATRGENGAVVLVFNSTLEYQREIFDIPSIEEQNNFLWGLYYIQISTTEYPEGAIRGQLEHKDRVYSRMNVQSTIPSSSGSTATGIALGTYSFYSPQRLLSLRLVHDVVDPIFLDVNIGYSNQIGETFYRFDGDTNSPFYGSLSFTLIENAYLFTDLVYLNQRSVSNPTGDIRGSLVSNDYALFMTFSSVLVGSGEGGALVYYDCFTYQMEYLIIHNLEGTTSGFLTSGSVIIAPLSTGISPIYGSLTLPSEYAVPLFENQLQLTVGNNELSGQINGDNKFWAYLSGTNEMPAISTPYSGLAILNLDSSSLSYNIYFMVEDVTSLNIRYGEEGNIGQVLFEIAATNTSTNYTGEPIVSPLKGSVELTKTDVTYLENDSLYIEITTSNFPLGVIRGQIRTLEQCDPAGSPISDLSTGYVNVFTYFDSFYPSLTGVVVDSSTASSLTVCLGMVLLSLIFVFY